MPSMRATLEYLGLRKKSYSATFGVAGIVGNEALKDLARFCRAFDTCFVPGDAAMSDLLEGRREVWLRIQQHLHLQPEQLAGLYKAVVQGD